MTRPAYLAILCMAGGAGLSAVPLPAASLQAVSLPAVSLQAASLQAVPLQAASLQAVPLQAAGDLRVVPIQGEAVVVRAWEIADGRVRGESQGQPFSLTLKRTWRLEPIGPAAALERGEQPFMLLRSGPWLSATLLGGEKDRLRFAVRLGGEVAIRRAFVRACRVQPPPQAGGDEGFERALAAPPTDQDWLFALNAQNAIQRLACRVTGALDGQLVVELGGEQRELPLTRVYGVVFADASGIAPTLPAEGMDLTLHDGRVLRGELLSAKAGQAVVLRLAEGIELRVPLTTVRGLELRSDRLVYLSALEEKSSSVVTPALGRTWPILRDRGLGGEPLRLGDRVYRRGFLLVPNVRLEYSFERSYDRLLGEVAIPQSRFGSAVLRILVGDKEVIPPLQLQADGRAVPLDVPLKSNEVTIELACREDLDAGAQVILGDLRVVVD